MKAVLGLRGSRIRPSVPDRSHLLRTTLRLRICRLDKVHFEQEGTRHDDTIDSSTRLRSAVLLAHRRRIDWLINLLLHGVLWSIYAVVPNLTGETHLVAVGNASSLLEIE